MKVIALGHACFSKVDDEDYERLINYGKWCRKIVNGGKIYAACFFRDGTQILMHNFIMGGVTGIDHKDNDGLNNQKSNLRLATNSENQFNKGLQSNNTTGYKGVCPYKGRFRAFIGSGVKKGKRQIYLGTFDTAEEAAKAYDEKAKEIAGQFARTNFN